MDATDPSPALPALPADLDDLSALDGWYEACNKWISDEAAKRNWSWFKPLTPALLHEIVENEKRRRAGESSGRGMDGFATAQNDPDRQREREEARVALNELEQRLTAQDSAYRAKRDLLLPILKPIFTNLPPSQWVSTFQNLYQVTRLPMDSSTHEGWQRQEAARLREQAYNEALRNAESDLVHVYQARVKLLATIKIAVFVGTLLLMAWFLSKAVAGLSYGPALLAVPLGALLFGTVGWMIDELLWRTIGRSFEVDRHIVYFRANNFPRKRSGSSDDVGDYLHWIKNNGATTEVRIAAAAIKEILNYGS